MYLFEKLEQGMKIKIELEIDTKLDADELEDLIEQLQILRQHLTKEVSDAWKYYFYNITNIYANC